MGTYAKGLVVGGDIEVNYGQEVTPSQQELLVHRSKLMNASVGVSAIKLVFLICPRVVDKVQEAAKVEFLSVPTI